MLQKSTKSSFNILVIILILCHISQAQTQSNLQCFVQGNCANSQQVGGTFQATSANQCLEKCKESGNCKWFTFYMEFNFCKFFSDCKKLDAEGCPRCVSGESACPVDPDPPTPTCWITGECIGTQITISLASSKEECLQQCKDEPKCNWFTYLSNAKACELLEDCPNLDETCSACISGERTCEGFTDDKGYVAFIVGGTGSKEVELFSPDGKCQYILPPVPVPNAEFLNPILGLLSDDLIIACGGVNNRDCWGYSIKSNKWSILTYSFTSHEYRRGLMYDRKLFIVDDRSSEFYDHFNLSGIWHYWRNPYNEFGEDACFLQWRDKFLLMGGKAKPRGIQLFNVNTSVWTVVNSDSNILPMDISNSGCTLMPDSNEVLIVGSDGIQDFKTALLYNPEHNTWKKVSNTKYLRQATTAITLGSRVFVIGGLSDKVEELNPGSGNWNDISATTLIPKRMSHTSIPVPARLFQHLENGCLGIL